MKIKNNRVNKNNDNFAFNIHRFYTTYYYTYRLLQGKEHI